MGVGIGRNRLESQRLSSLQEALRSRLRSSVWVALLKWGTKKVNFMKEQGELRRERLMKVEASAGKFRNKVLIFKSSNENVEEA